MHAIAWGEEKREREILISIEQILHLIIANRLRRYITTCLGVGFQDPARCLKDAVRLVGKSTQT